MSSRCRPAAFAVAAALAAALFVPLAGSRSQAAAAPKPAPNPAVLATPAPRVVPAFLAPTDQLLEQGYDVDSIRVPYADADGNYVVAMTRDHGWDPRGPQGPQVCVFANDARHPGGYGGTCTSFDYFSREGMFGVLTTFTEEPDIVFGLLPNGVDTVTVKSARGSRRVRVVNNAIRFVRGDGLYVKFKGPAGPVRMPIAPGLD